jgi:hypothetical protein
MPWGFDIPRHSDPGKLILSGDVLSCPADDKMRENLCHLGKGDLNGLLA